MTHRQLLAAGEFITPEFARGWRELIETGIKMSPEELIEIQRTLGLSDGKIASSIGVTRQTWRNWRRGCKCPIFAQNALRWMMELRRLDAANDNLPLRVRKLAIVGAAVLSCPELVAIAA